MTWQHISLMPSQGLLYTNDTTFSTSSTLTRLGGRTTQFANINHQENTWLNVTRFAEVLPLFINEWYQQVSPQLASSLWSSPASIFPFQKLDELIVEHQIQASKLFIPGGFLEEINPKLLFKFPDESFSDLIVFPFTFSTTTLFFLTTKELLYTYTHRFYYSNTVSTYNLTSPFIVIQDDDTKPNGKYLYHELSSLEYQQVVDVMVHHENELRKYLPSHVDINHSSHISSLDAPTIQEIAEMSAVALHLKQENLLFQCFGYLNTILTKEISVDNLSTKEEKDSVAQLFNLYGLIQRNVNITFGTNVNRNQFHELVYEKYRIDSLAIPEEKKEFNRIEHLIKTKDSFSAGDPLLSFDKGLSLCATENAKTDLYFNKAYYLILKIIFESNHRGKHIKIGLIKHSELLNEILEFPEKVTQDEQKLLQESLACYQKSVDSIFKWYGIALVNTLLGITAQKLDKTKRRTYLLEAISQYDKCLHDTSDKKFKNTIKENKTVIQTKLNAFDKGKYDTPTFSPEEDSFYLQGYQLLIKISFHASKDRGELYVGVSGDNFSNIRQLIFPEKTTEPEIKQLNEALELFKQAEVNTHQLSGIALTLMLKGLTGESLPIEERKLLLHEAIKQYNECLKEQLSPDTKLLFEHNKSIIEQRLRLFKKLYPTRKKPWWKRK